MTSATLSLELDSTVYAISSSAPQGAGVRSASAAVAVAQAALLANGSITTSAHFNYSLAMLAQREGDVPADGAHILHHGLYPNPVQNTFAMQEHHGAAM
jgi:hypothetical protein